MALFDVEIALFSINNLFQEQGSIPDIMFTI